MKEIRNCIMKFRATEEEKSIIMKKVDASDLSISEYLRRCALDKPVIVMEGVDQIAYELRAIGNNLNQITRAVNSGYIHAVNLQEMEEVLGLLWQSLNSLQQSVL
ncbi:MobC family plasmid mobilization relaxosome protein [Roseburia sp. MSJ-14]|nr:MobC family plasmid mobilization relaxosome protein [Roseburia sp. MSJ-14]